MRHRKIAIKEAGNKIDFSTKNSLLDKLLSLRGLTKQAEIEEFLNPLSKNEISPYAFCDMESAKKRIFEAIDKKEKILIWGDFDCDGVTSTTILFKALTKLKADVVTFIPDRLLHGHGLNSKELIKFISKDKVKLVITVDCATSNTKEIALLKSFKVDTIITDHHAADEKPESFAIINPQVQGSLKDDLSVADIRSLSYNSGSVIAYKLAMSLLEEDNDNELKKELLVIAASGAIADVVPLIGENRTLVTKALEILNNERKPKGIFKLLNPKNERQLNATDIAFILAPRINAVGRLANANLSFEFLNEKDDNKLKLIIEKLDNYNRIRQSMCTDTVEEILNTLKKDEKEKNNPAIILMNPDWHIGIIGIVAAKIVEEFNKPCFLMTKDEMGFARCSIRSNDTINVYNVLKENEDLFSGFGGHKLAGGLSFDLSKTSFEEVKKALLKTVDELKDDKIKTDTLYADIELTADELDLSIIETVNQLEPLGEGNEPPVFAMFDVELTDFSTIGKENNHLKFVFSKNGKQFKCVKWNESNFNIPIGAKCDIAFYPRLNTFNDVTDLQLEIVEVYSEAVSKKASFKIFDHRRKTGILAQIADYLKRDNLDIGIWAKTPKTKEELKGFETINKNIIVETKKQKGIMFFDYPTSIEEFCSIISEIRPEKIHLMNYSPDENIENYVKQILGMVKYCSNKLDGKIDIKKCALTLGTSESFILTAFEILESLESIKILDIDKIQYLKPFHYEEFKKNPMFEVLEEEFSNILNFKERLLNSDISEIEQLVESAL